MNHFFVALCCMLLTMSVFATNVNQDDAAKVAKNYFSEVLLAHGKNFPSVISESFEITQNGNPVFYVFNFEHGGYVMVSAEDRFTPILGYSPDGYYEQNNLPDGFEFLMEEFSKIITYIRENNISCEPHYAEKWARYQSENHVPDRSTAAVIIAPMTALWSQDYPYNFFCPVIIGGSHGKAYTGCAATALGMMLYYWRWPWTGTGEKPPYTQTCTAAQIPPQSANFGETFYDYNGMYGTPTITADKSFYEPIALLLYHAGVSINMQYCLSSNAYLEDVPNAMKNHFKYASDMYYVYRNAYNTAAWLALMKGQLDLKQPVYLSGHSPTVGHAFLCDGYDSNDMLHYNFGWNGSENGYFAADAPYSYYQLTTTAAVLNFVPDRTQGYPIDCNGSWILPHLKGMLADCSGPIDNYAAGVTASWLIDPTAAGHNVKEIMINPVEMDLAPGDYLRIYNGEDENAPLLGEFTGNDSFETIITTSQKVLVKFTSSDTSATATGFTISYEAKTLQCCDPRNPITFTEPTGKFTDGSPEGLNYSNNTILCTWNIVPENPLPETEILIKFNRLDTEEGKDLVKVFDLKTFKVIETFSGKYGPDDELPQLLIKTTKVRVTFSSNAYATGKGFEIEYNASPVNINELENLNSLAIYPNPVKDKLFIKFNTAVADDFNITICNVTGQEIYRETLTHFAGNYENALNISNFTQGVYILQIKSSKGIMTRKFVK